VQVKKTQNPLAAFAVVDEIRVPVIGGPRGHANNMAKRK